ncbi:MAG: McrC family protein [Kiritimatiellia bacterium]
MRLEDNHSRVLDAAEFGRVRRDLGGIAGRRLEEVVAESPGLLVFPHCLGEVADGLGESVVLDLDAAGRKVSVGNVMGFVGVGQTRLEIVSRFEDGGRDFFLHHLLGRVFSPNLFDWDFSTDRQAELELLPLLFPHFLKRALAQGIYREYRQREENGLTLRGAVDMARQLRENWPFAGRVACRFRERGADTDLMQLVRHTVEFLRGDGFSSRLWEADKAAGEAVRTVVTLTPDYTRGARQKVVGRNLRPRVHPLYPAYGPLRRICLWILREERLRFGQDSDEVQGILFDGAWLWEEYLATLLERTFRHPRNKAKEGAIAFFKDGHRRYFPDFHNEWCVLDAKYKGKSRVSENRDDLLQIVAYLHVLGVPKGGFIVPAKEGTAAISPPRELAGLGGELALFRLAIPQAMPDGRAFASQMAEAERDLLDAIGRFVAQPVGG